MLDRPAEADLARYRALVDGAPVAMIGVDGEGSMVLVNAAAGAMFGWPVSDLLARQIDMLVPERFRDAHGAHRAAYGKHPTVRPMGGGRDLFARRRDGSEFPVEISLAPTQTEEGLLVQVMIVDLTVRKLVESELERRFAQQAAIARFGARALEGGAVPELLDVAVGMVHRELDVHYVQILEVDEGGRWWTVAANTHVAGPIGIDVRERFAVAGSHAEMALRADGPVLVEDAAAAGAAARSGLIRRYGFRSGASVRIGTAASPLGVLSAYTRGVKRFDEHDEHFLVSVANVLADAITRRRIEDDMSRRAMTDALTGLPNRALLLDRLAHWREGAGRSGSQAALLFLDLDHFKVINDSLGHDVGDELLRAIGPRLQGAVRPADTVARFGGDEFVVLCEDITEDRAGAVAQRILDAFEKPVVLATGSHVVSPSIGVALSGNPPLSVEAMVSNADAALYRAKGRGRGRAETFEPAMRRLFARRMDMERELRTALDGGDGLRVAYQPIVDLASGEPAGFEALARWTHPNGDVVAPPEFVRVAEESGLIVELGRWVLRDALRHAASWQAQHPGAEAARVSVNLSPRQMADPRLVDSIADAVAEARTAPGSLMLEVTETALMDDMENLLEAMHRLRAIGVRIMLDDFGTGYSSLSHVRRFPISALKLDQSFVAELCTDRSSRAIASAVLHLADGLGAEVVAEGVETAAQADMIRGLGCRFGQGYLFGRPMDCDEASRMLTPSATA